MSPASSDLPVNGSYATHTNGTYTNGTGITNGTPLTNGHAGVNGYESSNLSNGFQNGSTAQKDFVQEPRHTTARPMAICGMACRLPGGIHTPTDLWDFLISKSDARSIAPQSRFNIASYYNPNGGASSMKTQYGYFLDESIDIGSLDASLFKLPRQELERLDPQQRQLLEVARECIEDAGEVNWRGKPIGCYVGTMSDDWIQLHTKDNQEFGPYRAGGFTDFMLSNRISYEMGLQGPTMTIHTACSSSLVALNAACEAIQSGSCSGAIIGGTNIMICPEMTLALGEQGVLSPDGSCKAFSADANGYARAEAINAIYVKPLDDAIRDGNSIRAVIRATAANGDGTTPNLTSPNAITHEAMIRQAYAKAGITDYSETAFVECHGTGTQTGDPIETTAIGRIFGDSGVYIGSVKANLGHSEGASGLTSLIKSVLALENRVIPPNIKFNTPNPKVPFEKYKLTVPIEPTQWPAGRSERVSINSFGIGGSNAHVVIDSLRSYFPSSISRTLSSRSLSAKPELLVYSAASQKSLQKLTTNLENYLQKSPEKLEDLAYTLANRREHLTHRAFMVARPNEAPSASTTGKIGKTSNLVMVFTGQGAQWPQMGRELMESNRTFQTTIRSLDKYLQELPEAPHWSIEEELLKPPKVSLLHTAEMSQPLCSALQIALVDTLASVGVEPSIVVGHSSGEIAGAYASGGLTAREAITAAIHRGNITRRQMKQGAMAAIGMSWEKTSKFLVPGVVIACENSPESVTISGDFDKLRMVVADIQKAHPEMLARLLKVDKAYHSHHMVEVGEEYYRMMEHDVIGNKPNKLFFSSVTGRLLTKLDNLGARYWQSNLQSPVLFKGAVESILQHPSGQDAVFLEIGPHSALAGPLRQILAHHKIAAPYSATVTRNQDSTVTMLSAIGQLYLWNIPVDFKALQPNGSTLCNLPPYPWNHETSYWNESRITREWRFRKFPYHNLLGLRAVESSDLEPLWRNRLRLDHVSWVTDHKVNDDIIFPFAGYVAIAGEAIRQISRHDDGFTLRHVVVNAPLVLSEGKATEIVTTFRKHRLSDELDSQWWEFSVGSYNGSIWMKHCIGLVKAQAEFPGSPEDFTPTSRKVQSSAWYETMRRVGLNYGPRFQGLIDIQTSTSQQLAKATIAKTEENDMWNYHIHPTVVDFFLQLLSVAVAQGLSRHMDTLTLPTMVEEISIQRCEATVNMNASAATDGRRAIIGQGAGLADGKCVLRMSGVKLSPVEMNENVRRSDTHPTAKLEWQPDITFQGPKELFKPSIDRKSYASLIDELTNLCVASTRRSLGDSESVVPHMENFRRWINNYTPTVENMSQEAMSLKISDIVKTLSTTPAAVAATAMQNLLSNIVDISNDEIEALEILLEDDILTNLYSFINDCDRSSFIQLLAHKKPTLRVLEIGAGTSGVTESTMKVLAPTDDRRLYSKYVLTDVNADFFMEAKERFRSLPNMEYTALDINKDPEEQGFEEGQYDLVIATNSLYTSSNLTQTLKNVRKLLHTDGSLLLQELSPDSKWINFILGTLPEWWSGVGEDRPNEPYVKPERWQRELEAAGFDVPEAVLDGEAPYQVNAIMVAKPKQVTNPTKTMTLLCNDSTSEHSTQILSALQQSGYEISISTLEMAPTPGLDALAPKMAPFAQGKDVLALLEIDQPFFEKIDADTYQWFRSLIANLDGSGIMWVTQSSQMHSKDPRYAQILGAARSIRSELGVDFATCEIDDVESSTERIVQVFNEFNKRTDDDSFSPEYEYAVSNGTVNVGRYHPFLIDDDLGASETANDKTQLEIGKLGRVETLTWTQQPAPALKDDWVEVDIYSVGMNFRDVLTAMGFVHIPKYGIGLEASGVVRKIGPAVKNLKVGDRVMNTGRGHFGSTSVGEEIVWEKIPDSLGFEQAATMPCVYATAIYSLIDIGQLRKGQSVLIHSALGGVGIASIQIAQMLGAEVYVTVGGDAAKKRQHLKEKFGIPENRIFNSRNVSFLDGVMRETQGRGIDVVLNSLSGELLHTSWKCVAEFGKLVEIGKRDPQTYAKLDMEPFLANRSYCLFDLLHMREERPEILQGIQQRMVQFFEQGHIKPIEPVKYYSAANVSEAFRYMQEGVHIGKIVVNVREASGTLNIPSTISRKERGLELDGSASYLLIGGLGGLGRSISSWMVENGARHLIYLSRSAGLKDADKTFFEELSSSGCSVQVIQGSVTNASDVQRAVRDAQKPLRGILNMSMVLRDKSFPQMSFDDWTAAVAPKVQGSWNLHNATVAEGAKLDFFVLFSSISGAIGQPGQANYASANTFLDAFVQYRNGQDLAASAIDIGAVEDVGYIANNDDGLWARMQAAGAYGIRETELLQALKLAMKPYSPTSNNSTGAYIAPNNFVLGLTSTIPLSHPSNRALWKRDRRMAVYHNTSSAETEDVNTSDKLQSFVKSMKTNPDPAVLSSSDTASFLAQEIGKKLMELLLREVEEDEVLDTSKQLGDLGLDSLIAIELRGWWKQVFGFDVSILELLGAGTLANLGKMAGEGLASKGAK